MVKTYDPATQRGHDLRAEDIEPGTCRMGYINGKAVAIYNVDGEFYATQTNCTHMGGPLCEGSLWAHIVTCPWHGSQFDVRDGKVVTDPAKEPLQTYPVRVVDGVLVVGGLED